MKKSTWYLIGGFGLLFVPIPPFATIAGIIVIIIGAVMKNRGD